MRPISFAIVIILCGALQAQTNAHNERLKSLVETERAFSRRCGERGVRDSFLEFFADDGINFQPGPVIAKPTLRARAPSPTNIELQWEPVTADVSLAGDLGYTTGPYVLSGGGMPKRYGYYFSLWKLQPDGSWKVVLDMGISTPGPESTPAHFVPLDSRRGWRSRAARAVIESDELINLERAFSSACRTIGSAEAISQYAAPTVRLHRDGVYPIVGRAPVRAYWSRARLRMTLEPEKAHIAQSGDLGYTYGKYHANAIGNAASVENGYYTRVWKKDTQGRWRVIVDVLNPS